jgi:hypothetical protein
MQNSMQEFEQAGFSGRGRAKGKGTVLVDAED